ncbi:MAG: winged helix-turn-helix domain-containing protein, partial [Terracidiphilus sp.]
VWGDTAVSENSLTRSIALLRRLLGEDTHQPHFIETVSTVGYRLICPVEIEESADASSRIQGTAASHQAAEVVPISGAASLQTPPRSWLRRRRWRLIAVVSIVVLSAAAFVWYTIHQPTPPRITETLRITNDPRFDKWILGADASRIYMDLHPAAFGEVPISGGNITTIPISIPNSKPGFESGIGPLSPDGSSLLAWGHQDSKDQLTDIWVVGTSGSPVRFLTRGWNAAWSADGKQVIYTTPKREIFTIPSAGGEAHLIRVMEGPDHAYQFAYSPDGTRIRFNWGPRRLMEMSPDGSNLHEILAGWHPDDLKGCGGWTPERDFFLFLSASSSERSGFPAFQLWALDERHAWVRKPDPRPVQLTSGPITWGTVGWGSPVVPSRDGQKIFIKGTINRGELVRYNRQTGQVEPFLGGISADEVSFSREGRYVAYASFPGRTLWRANKDGTGVQEIAEAMAYPEIPRWSPDGSQISFVDYPPNGQSGRRSKIYVVSSQGGTPVRILPADRAEESDPTWSPDGKSLAYWTPSDEGRTETELRIVDLATHKISYLPRPPKRAWSPRWSPDGRYIACLTNPYPATDGLEVYDFKTNNWKILLTESGSGNWASWSRDSRSIYFLGSLDENRQVIYRISVEGGRPERIADLPGLRPTGWIYGWVGFDPDENPIMLRDAGTREIYALTLGRK